VDLERALVAARLPPERPEMVEAARHQGREPHSGLVLRLVELHRQIDIADLERAARRGAEHPDLAHPRHVATLATYDALKNTADPPGRLRAFHRARLMRERNAAYTGQNAAAASFDVRRSSTVPASLRISPPINCG
jgi:hypothetical protein